MKISTTILIASVALALGSGGASAQVMQTQPPHQAQPQAQQDAPAPAAPLSGDGPAAIVEMTDALAFQPQSITVRVGDTVEWRSVGRHAHTITTDARRVDGPSLVEIPQGAEPFHSGPVSTRDVFRYTFTVPGRYVYVCVPHEGEGMIGEVIVEP